jgi:hypothetical protein
MITSDDKVGGWVGGWVKKGQNHDDVILGWSVRMKFVSNIHSFPLFYVERVNVFGETFLARFPSIKAYGEK